MLALPRESLRDPYSKQHMISKVFKLFSGRHHKKYIQKCKPIVAKINQLEEAYQKLSDDELKAKTEEFRKRYQDGESLDHMLPEAYAVVKNAARRLCGTTIAVCDHHLTWDMIHYDVQIMGGIALHNKRIVEMATGEGKTFVVTLPLYLNALTGRNCQLVTVNDYLARRDSEWMGYLYRYLGLTVGCIQNSMGSEERRDAYGKNVTYGTASEFGFDYLRDNGMALRREEQVQRDYYFCIIDEADSVLIDEARTPLIISGPADEEVEAPFKQMRPDVERLVKLQQTLCNRLVDEAKTALSEESLSEEATEDALKKLFQVRLGMPKNKQLMRLLEDGSLRKVFEKYDLDMGSDFNRHRRHEIKEELYFVIDEKQNQADLTEKGRNALRPDNPDAFVLPDLPSRFIEIDGMDLGDKKKQKLKQEAEEHFAKISEEIHCLSQLLRAYCLYEVDVHYVVQEGKVVIVDENTGRAMPGRRWSEGLHQAVEAKEHVAIEKESKTFATITLQNYFRLYDKLSGTTGTAETEASEFYDIYKLDVLVLPTNKPCIRKDLNDKIYKTRREKYNAVIQDVKEAHKAGQPVLVGTTSVEASEVLDRMLKRENIPHSVLNAKFHQQEAEIVARAGHKGAVTIATNMAGRGTDIKLGEGVKDLGGLKVIGTERHESRRIDRQLRGRCSRQGDPGIARFYISLEDDLMRLFANAGPIARVLEKTFQEGDELEHPLINRSIESAQKKVEGQNYSIRKRLLQYDDVLNKQREVIYGIRNDTLHCEDPKEIMFEMLEEELDYRLEGMDERKGWSHPEDRESFLNWLNTYFPLAMKAESLEGKDKKAIIEFIVQCTRDAYQEKEAVEEAESLKGLERYVIMRAIDRNWQDHLTEMEDLRRSVGLRSYGQKDPLNEYKSEAFVYFQEMLANMRNDICRNIFRSATNMQSFQTMVSRLKQRMQMSGPSNVDDPGTSRTKLTAQQKTKELPKPRAAAHRALPKVGRNDPCPCGSGKKYKKCCGARA